MYSLFHHKQTQRSCSLVTWYLCNIYINMKALIELKQPRTNSPQKKSPISSIRTPATTAHSLRPPPRLSPPSIVEVLHKVGAERACAAAITLDSLGAQIWALSKNFPNVTTYSRKDGVRGRISQEGRRERQTIGGNT